MLNNPSSYELGRLIWSTSQDDERTISGIGAGIVANVILDSDWLARRDAIMLQRGREEGWDAVAADLEEQATFLANELREGNPYRGGGDA